MKLRGFGIAAALALTVGVSAAQADVTGGTILWDFEAGAADWDAPNGTWEAIDGVYSETSGGEAAMHSVVGDLDWDDYTINARVRLDDGGQWAGIAFRVQSDFEYYVYYLNSTNNKSELWKHTDGAFDSRENLNDIPASNVLIQNDVWLQLQVVVAGDSFELWIDGELQSQDSDASYATGGAGVWAWSSTASFDDFSVTGDFVSAVEAQGKLTTAWGKLKDVR
jgi:xylan 1,4-beta-xylosidase